MKKGGCYSGVEQILFTHGESNSRGVAILISPKLKGTVELHSCDETGRKIAAKIKFQESEILLTNLYAPNSDEPQFFVDMFDKTFTDSENLIYIGDFNVVMEPSIDRKGEKCNNRNSCNILQTSCENLMLTDIWRARNNGTRRYSYSRKRPKPTASRIDFALTSCGIESKISSIFYIPCSLTDHSAVFLSLNFQEDSRGVGYWKFNNTMLQDEAFVQHMNQTIDELLTTYATYDKCERWELIKFNIANTAQQWARNKAQEDRFVISALYDKLAEMEENIDNLSEHKMDLMYRTKDDLKETRDEKS